MIPWRTRLARELTAMLSRLGHTDPASSAGHGARGQSLVEIAVALPMLTLVLLGTLDFGRLYFSYVSVANAARVGAAYGMDTLTTTPSLVKQRVEEEASPYVTIGDSDITITAPSWSSGKDLTVDVSAKFSAVTPLISAFWGGGPLTLHSAVTTRFN